MHFKFHFHFSEIIQMSSVKGLRIIARSRKQNKTKQIQNLRGSGNYSAFYYEEVVDFDFLHILVQ